MIFGRMAKDGKEFVLVGLSAENIAQMREEQPITVGPFPNDPVLANVTIILIAGEDEADMAQMLQKHGMTS